MIVLENEGFDTTFGPQSKAPYLSKTLTSAGVLLTQYYGTGHASLDNYIAMISGQAATPETRNDCQTYQDFNLTGITDDGQAIGHGCVYPDEIKTLARPSSTGSSRRGLSVLAEGGTGHLPAGKSAARRFLRSYRFVLRASIEWPTVKRSRRRHLVLRRHG